MRTLGAGRTEVGALAVFTLVALAGCSCGSDGVGAAQAELGVEPSSIDLGAVKLESTAIATFTLEARRAADVALTGVTFRSGGEPGGEEAFELLDVPQTIPALESAPLRVRFQPTVEQVYEVVLELRSNDAQSPVREVLLRGEGALPDIALATDCGQVPSPPCTDAQTSPPFALAFGGEPFQRKLAHPVTSLPNVTVSNAGKAPLQLLALRLEGADAAAFEIEGGELPAGGMTLEAGEGVNVPLRFSPTSETQASYAAELVIESDDLDEPELRVALSGELAPNQPPTVCANLVQVMPPLGQTQRYDSKVEWEVLRVPPPGGYDFSATREVEPRALVTFSALSDAADVRACTSDPEDGRTDVSFLWEVVEAPLGSPPLALQTPTGPTTALRPVAAGTYTLRLTVTDGQGHATVVPIRFAAVLRQDLVAELTWNAPDGGFPGVDLDLHLVRPSSATPTDAFSGVFSTFTEGPNARTSGDINGYAVARAKPNPSLDFDWGDPGTGDDPSLNVDDTGSGDLLESISLNRPENDPACATQACRYKLFVHHYADKRPAAGAAACTVDASCADGERCDCPEGQRCVANVAPVTGPSTAGRCLTPPRPVVRIFLKASPTPALTVPLQDLMPPDALALGAPCQMLHVADVVWPARNAPDGGYLPDGGFGATVERVGADGSGRVTAPELAQYGVRQQGDLACTPNVDPSSATPWFAREP